MLKSSLGGLLGFIVFLLDLWAIASVIRSDHSTGAKVGWTLFIIILPIIGLIAWAVTGPRANRALTRG